ncbi:hypothetical protein CBR_g9222 [Chara braunii]|uniref:Uncharacterized protein n=1 Tax=Chara braunii TaxID=69332 RepID=A0A388KPE6_CHABU|nr:hypothetical protein CBR_g9222 [Chara braunii]|eukprot:GBG71813.1 hypothetical protein CBR_g9222 [Chara braunii]
MDLYVPFVPPQGFVPHSTGFDPDLHSSPSVRPTFKIRVGVSGGIDYEGLQRHIHGLGGDSLSHRIGSSSIAHALPSMAVLHGNEVHRSYPVELNPQLHAQRQREQQYSLSLGLHPSIHRPPLQDVIHPPYFASQSTTGSITIPHPHPHNLDGSLLPITVAGVRGVQCLLPTCEFRQPPTTFVHSHHAVSQPSPSHCARIDSLSAMYGQPCGPSLGVNVPFCHPEGVPSIVAAGAIDNCPSQVPSKAVQVGVPDRTGKGSAYPQCADAFIVGPGNNAIAGAGLCTSAVATMPGGFTSSQPSHSKSRPKSDGRIRRGKDSIPAGRPPNRENETTAAIEDLNAPREGQDVSHSASVGAGEGGGQADPGIGGDIGLDAVASQDECNVRGGGRGSDTHVGGDVGGSGDGIARRSSHVGMPDDGVGVVGKGGAKHLVGSDKVAKTQVKTPKWKDDETVLLVTLRCEFKVPPGESVHYQPQDLLRASTDSNRRPQRQEPSLLSTTAMTRCTQVDPCRS